jgi:hypothetical protein
MIEYAFVNVLARKMKNAELEKEEEKVPVPSPGNNGTAAGGEKENSKVRYSSLFVDSARGSVSHRHVKYVNHGPSNYFFRNRDPLQSPQYT